MRISAEFWGVIRWSASGSRIAVPGRISAEVSVEVSAVLIGFLLRCGNYRRGTRRRVPGVTVASRARLELSLLRCPGRAAGPRHRARGGDRVALRALESARGGHLGDPQRPPGIYLRPSDVVGGAGSRHSPGSEQGTPG